MEQKSLSPEVIHTMIALLADHKVNFRIDLASTTHVAKRIIQSLPGVQELRENGPQVEQTLVALLQNEATLDNDNLTSISLHILEKYPTERVKLALAKPIVARRFTGFNAQLAAEAFLKAAGIHALRKDAIKIALREARKIVASNPPKMNVQEKQEPKARATFHRKKSLTLKK